MFTFIIVESNNDHIQLIKAILEKDVRIQIVDIVSSGEEAVEKFKKLKPTFILTNVELPGMSGFDLSEKLSVFSETNIIMMSSKVDQELFRMAMKTGAQDFLVIPFSIEEITESIQRVIKRKENKLKIITEKKEEKDAVIATLFSTKGGVGKTFLAVNIAEQIKKILPDSSVCLLDFNVQFGNVANMLNIKSLLSIVSLVDEGKLDPEIIEGYLISHESGIKILQCSLKPVDAEKVTADHLRNIIEILKKEKDYIIIDTAVSFREEELTIFDLSTYILLIGTYCIPSISNLKNCIEILNSLQHDNIKMIFNKKQVKSEITNEHIEKILKIKIDSEIPFFSEEVIKFINRGHTIAKSENKELKNAIIEVAKMIIGDDLPDTEKEKSGIFNSIKKIFS